MKLSLKTGMTISVLYVCASSAYSFGQQVDECNPVLDAKNISSKSSNELLEKATADSFCDEKAGQEGSSQYKDAEAAYKVASGSYKEGASTYKDYRSKYCKAGSSSYKNNLTASSYDLDATKGAIEAWSSCKELSSLGMQVKVDLVESKRQATIALRFTGNGGSTPLVAVSPSNPSTVQCVDAKNGKPIQDQFSSWFTKPKLGTTPLVLSCTSTSANPESVSIVTGASARIYPVRFAGATAIKTNETEFEAKTLRERISSVEARLESIANQLHQRLVDVEHGGTIRGIFQESSTSVCIRSNVYTDHCTCQDKYERREAAILPDASKVFYCTRNEGQK